MTEINNKHTYFVIVALIGINMFQNKVTASIYTETDDSGLVNATIIHQGNAENKSFMWFNE